VAKKVEPWEEDPKLHEFLARKVTIEGKYGPGGISYDEILPLQQPVQVEEKLKLDLILEADTLVVDQMPSPYPRKQTFDLMLLVTSLDPKGWEGQCPTSQIYDFGIIDPKGKRIWQWSWGKVFLPVITPVIIPDEETVKYPETWVFSPFDIKSEGTYTAWARFIASGQEVSRNFEVKILR
jgi:hypothetical protein